MEPSPTQDPHASEEHSEGPQPNEQDQGQDHPQDGGEPPHDAQGQVLTTEQVQDQEQAQDDAQDDQVTAPQLTTEEELERRAAKIASKLSTKGHLMKNVLGSIQKGVSTRRQLANYCEHHVFVSCVEPQKVYEDSKIWIGLMPCMKNSITSSATKCGVWCRGQRRTIMSLEPSGYSRTIKMLMELSFTTRLVR